MSITDFDLTDLDNFANGFPHAHFEKLRKFAPIYWHEPTTKTPGGEGFWSISTYNETVKVLHDPQTFSSETGGTRPFGGTIIPDLPSAGKLLNMMDDPRHQRVRRLVNRGFTPKTIATLEEGLRARTQSIIGKVKENNGGAGEGECDFLTDIAAELPLQVICQLIGAPEEDRVKLVEWVEYAFDFKTGDTYEDSPESLEAMIQLYEYGSQLIESKKSQPSNDMLSTVIHSELEGEVPPKLTEEELQLFFTLLFAAGADTTRNAIAGGILALIENKDQFQLLKNDHSLISSCVDEIVRWVSPAAYNRRTATADAKILDAKIRSGDKVVFWEASANRDSSVFTAPMDFRVDRDPNPHLGFGHGNHHCLGAALARLEIAIVLEEVLDSFSQLDLNGPVEFTRSNKHNGIRHLPICFKT